MNHAHCLCALDIIRNLDESICGDTDETAVATAKGGDGGNAIAFTKLSFRFDFLTEGLDGSNNFIARNKGEHRLSYAMPSTFHAVAGRDS
mmetsp:Transcript_14577/g.35124  ORF Transcript_14577/g.35124 Transcript_14577/m.35124 type:complete len:90 (-) Transcript_14577:860-1129(-)